MENSENYQKFLNYNFAFQENEISILSIIQTNNKELINEKGYIIKLNDYEELKNLINYKKYKNYYYNAPDKIKAFFNNDNISKIKRIKGIKYRTSRYIINMLLNNNKYILITPKLYDLISYKTNEGKEETPFFNFWQLYNFYL